MPWNAITVDDVLSEFNPTEQAKINAIQNAVDNLTPILSRAVNAARGSIIAGGNPVDAAGTIPDQLRPEVIAIARWRWLVALPGVNEALQSKDRRAAHDDAMKRLDDVAARKIKVELPGVGGAPVNAVAVARPGRKVDPGAFDKMAAS
jgi:hypothetical protein